MGVLERIAICSVVHYGKFMGVLACQALNQKDETGLRKKKRMITNLMVFCTILTFSLFINFSKIVVRLGLSPESTFVTCKAGANFQRRHFDSVL